MMHKRPMLCMGLLLISVPNKDRVNFIEYVFVEFNVICLVFAVLVKFLFNLVEPLFKILFHIFIFVKSTTHQNYIGFKSLTTFNNILIFFIKFVVSFLKIYKLSMKEKTRVNFFVITFL